MHVFLVKCASVSFVLLLFALVPSHAEAQGVGTIQGTVIDSLAATPLAGANVVLRGTRWGAAAGENGAFVIRGVPAGAYTLVATMMGYTNKTVRVVIEPGAIAKATFALVPAILPLIDEIQVTAAAVDPLNTSTPLTIIENEAIEFANPATTSDILGSQPGIGTARPGGWGIKTVIQGMSDDQIIVLLNGSRINQACPLGIDACVATIDPETIERIEVIKGPHSALYGSGNIGGVINIITKEPNKIDGRLLSLRAELTTGYESVSRGRKAMLNFTGGQGPFEFIASVGSKKHDSYRTPDGVVANSQFAETSLQAKARFRWRSNRSLQLTLDRYQGRNLGYPASFAVIPWENRSAYILDYAANRLPGLFSSFSMTASFQRIAHDMQLAPPQRNAVLHGNSASDTYGLRAEASLALSSRQVLTAGMEYNLWRMKGTRRDRISGEVQPLLQIIPDAFNAYWGLFAEYQYEPATRFSIHFGLRGDLVRSGADLSEKSPANNAGAPTQTFTSGNLGFLYEIIQGLNLTLSLGRGFKSATPVEQFLATPMPDGYYYLGTPGLAPEINESLRGAMKWMRGAVWGELAAFNNRLRDLIYPVVDPALAPPDASLLGVKRYANIQTARVQGFEAQMGLVLNPHFSFVGSATYSRGADTRTGEPLPLIPPLEAVARLKYESKSLQAEFTSRFVASQKRYSISAGEDATAGFSTLDFRFGVNLAKGYRLLGGIENILNRRYVEHLNPANISEPGRNVYMKLSMNVGLSRFAAGMIGTERAAVGETEQIDLRVTGMACDWCAKRLKRVLLKLKGVTGAEARFEDKWAQVRYQKGAVSPGQIIREIKDAGFEAKVISIKE